MEAGIHPVMGRGGSPLSGRLVFATGCRRSGTNWLQRILTAHPDVVGMPSETYLFNGALSAVAERFQHSNPRSPKTGKIFMSRDGMLDALRDLADRVFEENLERLGPDARYLVERTPWHVYDLGLIGQVYPDSRAIHIVRDGRDVARSLLSQDWGPASMEEAAEEWRSSVSAGRRAAVALGERYLEVRYEELLGSPEAGIRGMYEWLGLSCEQHVIERALGEATSEFNVDPKQPGVQVAKWRGKLSAADLSTFDGIAGNLLEELGYERAVDGAAAPARSRPTLGSFRRRFRRPASKSDEAESGYARFELFLDEIGAGNASAAVDMLGPQARVLIEAGGSVREGRGSEGARLLWAHMEAWSALEPQLVSGNVHPGPQTSTAVSTYVLLDGRAVARTLAASVSGDEVTSVSFFEFDLAAERVPAPL
jgi:sulfotransferase family protein